MSQSQVLTKAVRTKLYKTGQTRGADDDVIFQNRVLRNSTVLIPYRDYKQCMIAPTLKGKYENGFIVLIKPEEYFDKKINSTLKDDKLVLGKNLLVFYETRAQWKDYPILKGWKAASARQNPLKGQYVARIPSTTSAGESKIIQGFTTSDMKGAGIRVYEYADSTTIENCKIQLEFLFWSCKDINEFIKKQGLNQEEVNKRIEYIKQKAHTLGLDDREKLVKARIVDKDGYTICPLCLDYISSIGFCDKIQQAEGREVPDLTVTEVSLFHIEELRTGMYNHRPYNLGWGHHYCNVVVKDSGIAKTLDWMMGVLKRNQMV